MVAYHELYTHNRDEIMFFCISHLHFFNEHPEGKRFFFKKLKLHSVHIISQAAQTLNTINT